MTTAEKVRKAVAGYLGIEATQVTDDIKLGHMGIMSIAIKIGLMWTGKVDGATVAELIAGFEANAEIHEPAWEYEDTSQINSVRDAVVVAAAKINVVEAEKVTDDTVVDLKSNEEREAFSHHIYHLLGFCIVLDHRDVNKTVQQFTADYEDLLAAAKHGI